MSGDLRRQAWAGSIGIVLLLIAVAVFRGPLETPLLVALLAMLGAGWFLSTRFRSNPVLPAERVVKRRHSTAEALLATIPDPVILVDRRAVVMQANPAARALLPALKLSHPLSFALRAPDVLDGIEEVLRTGLPLKTPYATRVPTERVFEVQIGALPVPEGRDPPPGGGQPNIVLFLREMTSARRLETMRVDFVANASHELRTPLASLLGFIETLQGPAREDAVARDKFLGIMSTQARRMTRLVDDLLSLSRIELNEHVPPTRSVDLADLARQMVETQGPLAQERGVDLVQVPSDGAFRVLGDRDELLRVIENLVENAVKYGGSGGIVELSLRRTEGRPPRVELTVRDEGPGIAEEHIPRLTERFYRVDTASSRQQGGTGLGLAIVKHALNRHRGRLVVESEVGRGTSMRVTLPEDRPTSGREAADPPQAS